LFSSKADLNLLAFLHQEKPFTGFCTRSMLSLRIVRLAGNGKPFCCATGNMTKKKARTIVIIPHYRLGNGPSQESKTMSTPLYSKGRFHALTSCIEFCRFVVKVKKSAMSFSYRNM
jgi:hypothetical protein